MILIKCIHPRINALGFLLPRPSKSGSLADASFIHLCESVCACIGVRVSCVLCAAVWKMVSLWMSEESRRAVAFIGKAHIREHIDEQHLWDHMK